MLIDNIDPGIEAIGVSKSSVRLKASPLELLFTRKNSPFKFNLILIY